MRFPQHVCGFGRSDPGPDVDFAARIEVIVNIAIVVIAGFVQAGNFETDRLVGVKKVPENFYPS